MSYKLVQNLNTLKKLPKNYRLVEFSKLVKDATKNVTKIKKQDYLELGKIPIIDQGQEFIAGYSNDIEKNFYKNKAIIFGDHTRKFKYIDFPFYIGADGVKVLESDLKTVFPKYLYYFFQTLNIPNTGYNRHFKYLKDVKIILPPIPTQIKIAAALDKAQELIDKRKEQIQKYDDLLQSVFLDMFGDPVTNPKGWEVDILKEHLNIVGGYAFKSSLFEETGVPVIKIGTVNKGYFDVNTFSYYNEKYLDSLEKYLVVPNDLLISLTGTVGKEDYGNICRSTNEFSQYFLNQRVAKLQFNKETINDYYAEYTFKNPKFKSEIIKLSRGVRQANISNNDIYSLNISLPPLPLQSQFASIVKKVEEEKKKLETSLSELENNFNSIMQRAFKGELF
ncbi:restriction endonuclease subunit S [uncultured Ilyobacter sp.]|uniref:restriction endonuclease subunit S n=1 Tax=uncultured Ilyobacter sp. TaxID=544433 RepID=UPI0029C7B0A2|nr:restriction endonuclease subunit S [uncultured Ilyobacter sp.]